MTNHHLPPAFFFLGFWAAGRCCLGPTPGTGGPGGFGEGDAAATASGFELLSLKYVYNT